MTTVKSTFLVTYDVEISYSFNDAINPLTAVTKNENISKFTYF